MEEYEQKLNNYIKDHQIKAEQLIFTESCHSVEEAAKAANAKRENFVKNICLIDPSGILIVAIVKGEDRASTTRIAELLNIERPRIATPDEILKKTGYPCGGVPSFGYAAIFIIDEKVMQNQNIYTGGGSENSLVKISPQGLLEANKGLLAKIRKS